MFTLKNTLGKYFVSYMEVWIFFFDLRLVKVARIHWKPKGFEEGAHVYVAEKKGKDIPDTYWSQGFL